MFTYCSSPVVRPSVNHSLLTGLTPKVILLSFQLSKYILSHGLGTGRDQGGTELIRHHCDPVFNVESRASQSSLSVCQKTRLPGRAKGYEHIEKRQYGWRGWADPQQSHFWDLLQRGMQRKATRGRLQIRV